MKPFSTLARLGGAGYRDRNGSYPETLGRYVWEAWQGLTAPLEFWLGRPINPDLKGHILSFLRTQLKSRELKVTPEDLMYKEDLKFLERTLGIGYVKACVVVPYCTGLGFAG